ncbi:MAG: peptidylprolyl isomerase [Isosphaeraceae bacterium]|nr:peptidylprolyl isomerase [Isosphaeraceae bacterium]
MARNRRRTWVLGRIDGLEPRLLPAAPVMDAIANVSVPSSKTRVVPVTASDADGDVLSYTLQTNNSAFVGRVLTNTVDLKMTVAGHGDLVFKLFPDLAPNTVNRIVGLVDSGFYNGLTFHRVIRDFMIQGGDPAGNGSGGPGFQFDDEFNPELIFSGTGQLAMANSGKDTNGSQFFITTGSPRWLDFEHTIFGQLVRGFDVLDTIEAVPTGASDRPTTPVVISSMSVTTNKTDAVLLVDSESAGSTVFTVTATDPSGATASRTFTATSQVDTNNTPPILGPAGDLVTLPGRAISIPLQAIDLESSPLLFDAAVTDSAPKATKSVSGNVVTITPEAGYVGAINVIVGVRQQVNPTRWDTQRFVLTTRNQAISAESVSASIVEGTTANRTIARFTPAVPLSAQSFTATVAWGSNAPVAATVSPDGNGSFLVIAQANQPRFGQYPYSVQILDTISNTTASTSGSLTVTDAALTSSFQAPSPLPGTRAVAGTVAVIQDANLQGQPQDLSATIAWGDGTTTQGDVIQQTVGVFEIQGSHDYGTLGSFEATVTITSQGGASTIASGTILIGNLRPTIASISSKTIDEGSTLAFTVSASDPDPGQTLTYSLGAGAPAGVQLDANTGEFRWTPGNGPQTANITIQVADNGTPQLTASRSFTVTVNSVAPSLQVPQSGSIRQTETFSAGGSIVDPGIGPWTATVNYGDGSGTQALSIGPDKNFAMSRRYDTPGNYTVTVVVTDAALPNAPVSKSFVVNVANVTPTIEIGGGSVMQFDTFQSSGRFNDVGAGSWQATFDPGDGSGARPLSLRSDRTFDLAHSYSTAGSFLARVTVTDQYGARGESTMTVNVAPRPLVSIVSARTELKRGVVQAIVLELDGDVNFGSASNAASYVLATAGRDRRIGTRDDVLARFRTASVSGRTIRLTPLKRMTLSANQQLRITGVVDPFGRALGRSSNGVVTALVAKKGTITIV